jgi:hypothetical protein
MRLRIYSWGTLVRKPRRYAGLGLVWCLFCYCHSGYAETWLVSDLNRKTQQATMQPVSKLQVHEALAASSSAQFDAQGLQYLRDLVQQTAPGHQLVILDLRQEAHGFLNEGLPVSWYGFRNQANVGKTAVQILQQERCYLQQLRQLRRAVIFPFRKNLVGQIIPETGQQIEVQAAYTEASLAKRHGVAYHRFYWTDHLGPTAADLEAFLAVYQCLPQCSWLHMHCRGGAGRAPLLLAIYDILRHGKHESLATILRRHPKVYKKQVVAWKRQAYRARQRLLVDLHAYVVATSVINKASWKTWRASRTLNRC